MSATHRFPVSVKGVGLDGARVVLLRNEREEWELPGGKLEPGQGAEECVVRAIRGPGKVRFNCLRPCRGSGGTRRPPPGYPRLHRTRYITNNAGVFDCRDRNWLVAPVGSTPTTPASKHRRIMGFPLDACGEVTIMLGMVLVVERFLAKEVSHE